MPLAGDDVAEAAVFGVTDARLCEVVPAWVVPRAIGVTGSIPRTSVGKLARNALQPVVPPATVEH